MANSFCTKIEWECPKCGRKSFILGDSIGYEEMIKKIRTKTVFWAFENIPFSKREKERITKIIEDCIKMQLLQKRFYSENWILSNFSSRISNIIVKIQEN